MMKYHCLLLCLMTVTFGCDAPEVSDARVATPSPQTTATTPTQQALTATEPAPEKSAPSTTALADNQAEEDEFEGWWQLQDDSSLTATFEPTPPKPGKNKLRIEIDQDDWEQNFGGTLAYRVSSTEVSDLAWIEITKVREDEHGTSYYETEIDLPVGGAYVQFHLKDAGEEEFTDLTDWKVTPR